MAKLKDASEIIKSGVKQAIENIELVIGMSLAEAVEKQIPKKPIVPCTLPVCPVCDSFVNEKGKYCHECGQALDWSEIEIETPKMPLLW